MQSVLYVGPSTWNKLPNNLNPIQEGGGQKGPPSLPVFPM